MGQLLLILIPFLIADIINPVLLGGAIYTLGSRHPYLNTWAMFISFAVTYFISGLIIAVGLEFLTEAFEIPLYYDYIFELFIAALLFYFAWKQWKEGDQHPEERLKHEVGMTVWDSLILGLQINIVGLPFAIPYLGAIDQILKAEINPTLTFFVLLLYNIAYILPYTPLIAIRRIYHQQSGPILEKINQGMHRIYTKYMPWILLLLGLVLIEDAVSYLIGYREYSLLRLI